jgi:hypothetical protein
VGSVHPGGGIRYAFSAKIASQIIVEQNEMKKHTNHIFIFLNSSLYFWLDWFCSQSFFFSPFTPYTLLLTCFVFLIHSPLTDKKLYLRFSFWVLLLK